MIAASTVALMIWAHNQPHVTCDPTGQRQWRSTRKFAQTAIAQDRAGKATASHATVQMMRDDWDSDATSLQAINDTTWTLLDNQMDAVLKAYAIDHGQIKPAPAAAQETQLKVLLSNLQGHHF